MYKRQVLHGARIRQRTNARHEKPVVIAVPDVPQIQYKESATGIHLFSLPIQSIAVSYTHLDVYKRQGRHGPGELQGHRLGRQERVRRTGGTPGEGSPGPPPALL